MDARGSRQKTPDGLGEMPAIRAVPLYEQVIRYLSELILLGTWPPGTVLPPENDLATRFGVSVGTIRRAMTKLTAEGLLTRRPRTGTVVTGRSPHHSLRLFFQFFRLHDANGRLLQSDARALSCEAGNASHDERQRLFDGRAGTEQVIRFTRQRLISGKPAMWEVFVLPAAAVPGFPTDAVPPRLYVYLLEEQGIRISAVRESITAELSEPRDRELLDFTGPAAVLQIDEVAYDQRGRPVIWAIHRALTHELRYVNELS